MLRPASELVADSMSVEQPWTAAADPLDDRTAARWAWWFVALGVLLRVWRYLIVMPLWQDEQLVAINLHLRDYAGLLRPLDLHQVAPVGYLLAVKWLTAAFGFHELSLRAVSLACGCGALVLFRLLAARWLRGTALAAAVGVLAVAYFPARHAAELKPYACDLFFATLLLWCGTSWLRQPSSWRPPLVLCVAVAAALPFSFPAVFVAGGVSLAMLPTVLRRREARLFAAYAVYNLALLAVFGGLMRLAIREQFAAATQTDFMYGYWTGAFPPSWREAWRWPLWLVDVHTGEGMAYPFGSKRGGSTLSALLALVGGVAVWKQGRRGLPTLAAATLGLGLVAAVLGRYPYGHGERLQQYWAPLVCSFMGAGIAALVARGRSESARRRSVGFVVGLLIVLGAAQAVDAQLRPYKHRWDRSHQMFSRWFWRFAAEGEPLLCVTEDFGRLPLSVDRQKSYLTYQAIERRAEPTQGARLAAVPSGSSLACVAFEIDEFPRDEAALAEWLQAMQRQYRLVDERRYPIRIDDKPGKTGAYHVWRWEPLSAESRPEPAALPLPYRAE